jgi:hypothetical protein
VIFCLHVVEEVDKSVKSKTGVVVNVKGFKIQSGLSWVFLSLFNDFPREDQVR